MKLGQAAFFCLVGFFCVAAILGGQIAIYQHLVEVHTADREFGYTPSINSQTVSMRSHNGTLHLPSRKPVGESEFFSRDAVQYFPFDAKLSEHAAELEAFKDAEQPVQDDEPKVTAELTGPALTAPTESIADNSPTANSDVSPSPLEVPGPAETAIAAAPDRFPHSHDAAPLPQKNPLQELRDLLQEELSGLSEEEQEIWSEELRDMPLPMARDVLKMRRRFHEPLPQIGSLPRMLPPQPPTTPLDELVAQPSVPSKSVAIFDSDVMERLNSTTEAIRLARHVVLNNVANAQSAGFKRSRLTFEDVGYDYMRVTHKHEEAGEPNIAVGWGMQLSATPIDFAQGEFEKTGRSLDLAIEGDGLFQVRDGAKLVYTRTGRFGRNADGSLVLDNAEHHRALEPRIVLPTDAVEIRIAQDGRVMYSRSGSSAVETAGQIQLARFANPERLERHGECLFAASEASGEPRIGTPGTDGRGVIRQQCLERSNVKVDSELEELKRLNEHLKCITEGIEIASSISAAAPIVVLPESHPTGPGVVEFTPAREPLEAPRIASESAAPTR